MPTEWKLRNSLLAPLFLQFLTCALILFDVPVARQVIGFIYFTTIPGIIIVKLLKLDELDKLEMVLCSVGFSVAFLMFSGLLMNEFGSLFGIPEPLSLTHLMIVFNSFIFIGGFLAFRRSERIKFWGTKTLRGALLALSLAVAPLLSVLGALWVNAFGNNLVLLLMIVAIALFLVVGVVLKRLLTPRLYPFAVLVIAISLLFHCSLISNYIISFGSDVSLEYFVGKAVEKRAYWNPTLSFFGNNLYQRINSMLSITILPNIYSSLLNMELKWVVKIVFPLIFSFVPLVLYKIWQRYVGRKYAFISTFLFMAQVTFYTEMLGLTRQMIAELFFVLLLLVIFKDKMKPINRGVCFMVFSVALITSHYALAEIFLLLIFLTLISLVLLRLWRRGEMNITRVWSSGEGNITISMVTFFFVVMFFWYIYTSNSAVFESFLLFGESIYNQLGEFFNPISRGETVMRGLGLQMAPSIWSMIGRGFAYVTQALIAIGFVGLVTRRIKIKVGKEYFMLTAMAAAMLASLLLVPGLAETMNMTRFYHVLLFILAPLFTVGGRVLFKLLYKREEELKASILLLIVLVPYFLFQTSFAYEVTGSDSWSLPLSKHRMHGYYLYRQGYIYKQDEFGGKWMSENVDTQNTQVYADQLSKLNILIPHSLMYGGHVNRLSNTTRVPANGTVYLSWLNVVEGLVTSKRRVWETSELTPVFEGMCKVYSNGASEIYKRTAP